MRKRDLAKQERADSDLLDQAVARDYIDVAVVIERLARLQAASLTERAQLHMAAALCRREAGLVPMKPDYEIVEAASPVDRAFRVALEEMKP